jgi:hypothetical protein
MYSDLDLILACATTAVVSQAVWIVPRWLDRRRTRKHDTCAIPGPHNGPCQPHFRGNR